MTITHFDRVGIEARIPHRHENMLLDHVECEKIDDTTVGRFSVQFGQQQPRDIFLETVDSQSALIPTLLVEILALASIVCTDYPDDSVIIFASISNFVIHRKPSVESPLFGTVTKLKDKGNFVRCRGVVESNAGIIADSELMAFIIPKIVLADEPGAPKLVELPECTTSIPVDKTRFNKVSDMVVCDEIVRPFGDTRLVGKYTYPPTHPLTKGHFPHTPIMMGVMQILGIEDTVTAGLGPILLNGHVTGDCQIIRSDGALIADIKEFVTEIIDGKGVFRGTKKVVFRESVRPGDTLLIALHNIQAS
ncbi:hypothetical protein EB093_00600 [bacterium]|nr:hypothetical protein [bacterium]